ncbi:MAG: integrase [Porticoccaceae bacterium]|jgi:integrase
MQEITVRIIDRKRKFYYMRAELPDGSRQERSTGVETGGRKQRKEADRVAAVWEAELREGRFKSPSKVSWSEFTERYDREGLSGLAPRTREKAWGAFTLVAEILKPNLLSAVTTSRISYFTTVLRERGRAEDTIAGILGHLKASLRWAGSLGMLHNVPRISMPKRAKGAKIMKGRPLAGEEFERMLTAVPLVVGEAATDSWNHLLNGLWWSGLRLEESLNLTWDLPDTIRIDVTGRFVMLRIGAENEKGNRDRLYPVAPEFADMILEVREADRTGHFFRPLGKRGGVLKSDSVGKVASKVGKRANIVVDPDGGQPKFASAHDLRRSFGLRWSERVMPAQLKDLMRHESIAITMNYYVGRNADTTAAALYESIGRRPESQSKGDTSGDTLTIGKAAERKAPT